MRKIKASELALDVHAGMNDSQLMEKYKLSVEQLERVLRKLLETDHITHIQFYERTPLSESQLLLAHVEWGSAIRELD